ncbi:hypothetical protein E2C01_080069 [Portunus trituberculatus]|uniref:Uncharacterized protein n=1 Tax=Portunus trituberculatus TaxID=210409 RepID=A0A5B7IL72_PORTR|nr:hypothetical protein [Portunus trituberculatus]
MKALKADLTSRPSSCVPQPSPSTHDLKNLLFSKPIPQVLSQAALQVRRLDESSCSRPGCQRGGEGLSTRASHAERGTDHLNTSPLPCSALMSLE